MGVTPLVALRGLVWTIVLARAAPLRETGLRGLVCGLLGPHSRALALLLQRRPVARERSMLPWGVVLDEGWAVRDRLSGL